MTRESQSVSSGHYASLLENEQLYDLFVSKVSRESAEIIEAHSNRVRNRTTIFVTVGLAFVAAIFALAL